MLRSARLIRLPRLRTIHTSPTIFERLPTFTTPTPSPQSPINNNNQSPPTDQQLSPPPPLPPTNLPVEDYASPLLHTATFFSTLFRYSVYSSVGIVTLVTTSLIGVHLYVEHVALSTPNDQDVEEWFEEGSQGWSGKHLEKGGGTDPRLGMLARSAIRGAWISMNWNSGTAASPLSQTQTQPQISTTSRFGPRMIGQEEFKKSIVGEGSSEQVIRDSGWLLAEQYLVFALKKASERGISLVEPKDWEIWVEKGGVDRCAIELEERLAGLRERLGGRLKLELAREGWERIYNSLNQSPSTDLTTPKGRKLIEWEEREKLLASRKLGELSQRISKLWGGKDSEQGQIELQTSKDWFIKGLQQPFTTTSTSSSVVKLKEQQSPTTTTITEKHVSPKSSFFSFWSRSHPPSSSSSTTTTSSLLSSELSSISQSIESIAPESIPPSTSRAILSSLVSLETLLAKSYSTDLSFAQKVQNTALIFAKRLASSDSNSNSTSTSTSSPESTPTPRPKNLNQVSKLLSSLYLTTRISILETHLKECELAAASSSKSKSKKSLVVVFESGLKEFKSIQSRIQSVLKTLPPTPTTSSDKGKSDDESLLLNLKGIVGISKPGLKILQETIEKLRRDAEKVESINKSLINFLEEKKKQTK
ncbi:hypothetical protein JCM3765_001628 [Sporobolomyces pararoseus]